MSIKAVATIQNVGINPTMPDGQFIISYTVAINNNGVGINFGADAPVTSAQTIPQFQAAAKNKIVADCAARGITLLSTDITIFATPF